MAVTTNVPALLQRRREEDLKHGMTCSEGVGVFCRTLQSDLPQVLVSTRDLQVLLQRPGAFGLTPEAPPLPNSQSSISYARPALPSEYVAPSNAVERVVAEMWEELLGIRPVGVHDDFFELGGHSVLALQLLSRLRETFQVEARISVCVDDPGNVAQLTHNMVAQDSTPDRIEKIARVLITVNSMSPADVSTALKEKNLLPTEFLRT